MNLTGVVAFTVGAVLMYAAVKNKDPRDVVLTSLGQKPRYGTGSVGVGSGFDAGAHAGGGGGGGGGGSW